MYDITCDIFYIQPYGVMIGSMKLNNNNNNWKEYTQTLSSIRS
jgi:hypothetical protein